MGFRAAGFVGVIVVCFGLITPARADESAEQRTVEHHRRALELYDAGDVALALVEFERAYAANASYKTLFNIGQIHFQLGHYAKARQALEKYLSEGGDAIPATRRAEVEQDLTKLRLRTGHVAVTVSPPGAELRVNDEPVVDATAEILVDAGTVRIHAEKDGFLPVSRELILAGGEQQRLGVTLVPLTGAPAAPAPVKLRPDPSARGVPPVAVAGWITTGVLLAGTVGVGVGALITAARYEDDRTQPIHGTPADAKQELEQQRSTVKALALSADVLAVATIVSGALSTYLTFRPRHAKPTAPALRAHGLGARFEVTF